MALTTQLLLARKEIERTKKLLESSESTRARALGDLERTKRTMLELTTKLKAVKDSMEFAIAAAEAGQATRRGQIPEKYPKSRPHLHERLTVTESQPYCHWRWSNRVKPHAKPSQQTRRDDADEPR